MDAKYKTVKINSTLTLSSGKVIPWKQPIIQRSDSMFIPLDEGHQDYKQYLQDLENGESVEFKDFTLPYDSEADERLMQEAENSEMQNAEKEALIQAKVREQAITALKTEGKLTAEGKITEVGKLALAQAG